MKIPRNGRMMTKNVQATSYQPLVAPYSFGDVDQNGADDDHSACSVFQ
jgi:hypothetical protein